MKMAKFCLEINKFPIQIKTKTKSSKLGGVIPQIKFVFFCIVSKIIQFLKYIILILILLNFILYIKITKITPYCILCI